MAPNSDWSELEPFGFGVRGRIGTRAAPRDARASAVDGSTTLALDASLRADGVLTSS
jgi:hypothetical protein